MYLTYYKEITNTQQQALDYRNLLSTPFIEPERTYTKITACITPTSFSEKQAQHITATEQYLTDIWSILSPFKDNYEEQYYTFQIPKRSGGLRTINAPLPEFKLALTAVKNTIENRIKCLPHNSAYAYVKERSILDALKLHQQNHSNWYLKIDIKDFFSNCTPEFIHEQLCTLYPFYGMKAEAKEQLYQIIKICCKDNGLPQGTPISPLLTNLIMVPIDYTITNTLRTQYKDQHYVYTRYADDILISAKSAFNWRVIQEVVATAIAPLQIKREKTRYGSKAGRNWNLGLMLNKDNNITLGSVKKKTLNAMINNFTKDYKNNIHWSKEDIYILQGQLGWLKHIEPAYYTHITRKYRTKYQTTHIEDLIRVELNRQ